MTTRGIEIMVGVFVALGLGALFVLSMQVSNLGVLERGDAYEVTAHFDNVGGLKVRSPVSAAGVTVGRVTGIEYNMRTYSARVTLAIQQQYDRFPRDTSASIQTAGLLGEQYVALEPGAEEEVLAAGDVIDLTQSALVLEELIGRFLFERADADRP
jgi:phospholipid/cholesterol/gamma-HCH transport system substrate-binding protein